MAKSRMSAAELHDLPVSVDLTTAGRAFGLGRSRSFELAARGDFPCRVLRIGAAPDGTGGRYRVSRAAIFEALGVKELGAEPLPAA